MLSKHKRARKKAYSRIGFLEFLEAKVTRGKENLQIQREKKNSGRVGRHKTSHSSS